MPRNFVDMKRSDQDKMAADSPFAMSTAGGPTGPDYPYGLRISLGPEELAKLDLDSECQTGDMLDLRAFAKVISKNEDEVDGKVRCRVELQITQLAIENEEEDETPKRAGRYK